MSIASIPQTLMARQPVRPPDPTTGITPDLWEAMAKMKVESDATAAKNAMAMQQGQEQPTVVQGLNERAMQSARQEIAQKLGLPGLANQGQNIPQGGQPGGQQMAQAPQGAPPMQKMAAGGLVGLPSNLPSGYAGGGIVSFAEGGSGLDVGMPEGYVPMTGVSAGSTETPDNSADTSMWDRWIASLGDAAIAAAPVIKRTLRAIAGTGNPVTPEVVQQVASAAPTAGAAIKPAAMPGYAQHQGVGEAPYAPAVEQPAGLKDIAPPAAGGRQSFSASARTSSGSGGGARTAGAGAGGLGSFGVDPMDVQVRKNLMDGMQADPAAAEAAGVAKYQDMVGKGQDEGLLALRKNQEAKTALHEQRQSQRGNTFLGMNVRALEGMADAKGGKWYDTLGAGARARTAGDERDFTEDQAYLETMNKGITAMNAARNEGNKGKYEAAKAAAAGAMARISGSTEEASKKLTAEMQAKVSMRNADLQAETSRANTSEMAAMRMQQLKQGALDRGDRKTMDALLRTEDNANKQGTARAKAEAEQAGKMGDSVEVSRLAAQYAGAIMEQSPVYQKAFTEYTGERYKAPVNDNPYASAAAAELKKRTGG